MIVFVAAVVVGGAVIIVIVIIVVVEVLVVVIALFLLCWTVACAFCFALPLLMLLLPHTILYGAQSRLRLVFANLTSASLRKVEKRFQSPAFTQANFSSYQGVSDFLAWCCRTEG